MHALCCNPYTFRLTFAEAVDGSPRVRVKRNTSQSIARLRCTRARNLGIRLKFAPTWPTPESGAGQPD